MPAPNRPESPDDTETPGFDLLTMPKPSVRLGRSSETMLGRILRVAVNFVVALVIVLSPLALGYLVNGIDGFNTLFPIVSVLFMIVTLIGSLVTVFVVATPDPTAGLAHGQYFTRWQLDQDQQQSVRHARRRELWKLYLFAAIIFGLAGLGVGSGSVDRDALDSIGETVHVATVILGFAAIGMTISAFVQWRQRGVNGLAELTCREAIIGPGGIYLAGVHTPLELLTRVYQKAEAADEPQFEFREPNDSIKTLFVPYPAEQRDVAGQLQSLLNEHDVGSLGMMAAELPIASTNHGVTGVSIDETETAPSVTYSYKLNASPGRYNLRLTDHSIEVFDVGGTAVREIEFSQIKTLYEYDGINASDPRSGGYKTEYCQIKVAWWKSLTIRNGSDIAPNGKMGEYSANQQAEFETFTQELKQHIAAVRPNVPVETGSTIVVLICAVVVLLGLFFGLVAFAPAETIGVRLGMIGVATLMGGPMIWFGSRGAFSYWPRRRPVREGNDARHNRHEVSVAE